MLYPSRSGEDTVGVDGDVVTPGGIVVPARAITWRFSRGTGPGGQGVNTTDSRVELVVDLTALMVSNPSEVAERIRVSLGERLRIVAATERSQVRNRETAIRRLGERLDAAARPRRPRRPTRPTAASVRRRLEAKRKRSQVKTERRDPTGDSD